jgi:hypothetical protein
VAGRTSPKSSPRLGLHHSLNCDPTAYGNTHDYVEGTQLPQRSALNREDFQHGRLLDSLVVLFILIVKYECVEQVCTSGGDESCSVLFLSFTVKGGVFVPPRVVANSVSESALVGIESVRMAKESEQIGG